MASGFLVSTLVCRNIFCLPDYDGMTKMHIQKKIYEIDTNTNIIMFTLFFIITIILDIHVVRRL